MRTSTCDICGKNIGLRWYELKKHHKEMDYGMILDEGNYDLCSKSCLEKLVDKLKEFTKLEMMYDSPSDHPRQT